MALTDELLVKIAVETSQVPPALKLVSDALQKVAAGLEQTQVNTKKTADSLGGVGAAAVKLYAGFNLAASAIQGAKASIEGLFKPFLDAQDATTRLSNTLQLLGTKNVNDSVVAFRRFATQLQATTVVEDDHAINLIAMAKATGLSDDATKKLLQTSADIAAVTGEDVDTAFQNLLATYRGTARGVALLEPQLQNLTKEQLQNGKAVDILAEKYQGFAEKELDTFSGKTKQAANIVGDILEDIGQSLIVGFNLKPAGEGFISVLKEIQNNMTTVQSVISATAASIKSLFTILADVGIVTLSALKAAFHGAAAGLADLLNLLPNVALDFLGINEAKLKAFKVSEFQDVKESLNVISSAATDIADEITGAAMATQNLGKVAEETARKTRSIHIPKPVSEESLKLLGEIGKKQQELAIKIATASSTELQKLQLKGSLDMRDLDLMEEKIKRSKDMTALQKEQGVAMLENSKVLQDISVSEERRLLAQQELTAITAESMALGKEFARLGDDQEQQIRNQLADQLEILDAKKQQLALDAEANAGAIAGLNAQAEIAKELAGEKVLQIELANLDPLAQVFASGARDVAEAGNGFIGGFNSVFGTNIDKFSNEQIRTATLVAGKIADGVVKVGGFILSVVQKLFDPKFIQNLADQLNDFVDKLPDALSKAFNALIGAFSKLTEKLPDIVNKLMDTVENALAKLIQQAPKLIESMAKALGNFLDRLPEIFGQLADAIPGILDKFLKTLPELIKKLFNALGSIIAGAVKALPEIVKTLADNLPAIVESIIEGVITAISTIGDAFLSWFTDGGAERMVGSILRAIPKLIVAIVQGVVRGIANGLQGLFKGVKLPDGFTSMPTKLADGVKDLAAKVTNESSQLFKVLDLKAAAHGQSAAKAIQDAIDQATSRLGTQFKGLIAALVAAWRWIYDKIIQPIFDGLKAVWDYVYTKIIAPAWAALQAVWDYVYTKVLMPAWAALQAVWDYVNTKIIGPMNAALQAVWDYVNAKIIQPFLSALGSAWAALGTAWDTIKTKVIDPLNNALGAIWDTVKTAVVDKLVAGFEFVKTLKEKIVDILSAGFTWITTLKEKIVDKLTAGFTWITTLKESIVDKLGGAFQWVNDLKDTVGKIFSTPGWIATLSGVADKLSQVSGTGGGGGGGNVVSKAGAAIASAFGHYQGGMIYASAGQFVARGSDTEPAMLARGEFVVRKPAVDSLGLATMQQINAGRLPSGPAVSQQNEIHVNISFDGLPDEAFVRTKLVPQIKRELKNASLKGEQVVSARGVFTK